MANDLLSGDHESFVKKILGIHAQASGLAGRSGLKRQIGDLVNGQTASDAMVLDARFALGGDDGQYLRSNVMPLQTVDDQSPMGNSRLLPQLEASGRMGLLDALEVQLNEQRSAANGELTQALGMCAYLISLPEVALFVSSQLSALGEPHADAADLVTNFNKDVFVRPQNQKDLELRRSVMGVTALLFGKPMETVREQWETTIGVSGTGTVQLQTAIERLAMSARYWEDTYDADNRPLRPVPLTVDVAQADGEGEAAPAAEPTETLFESLKEAAKQAAGVAVDEDEALEDDERRRAARASEAQTVLGTPGGEPDEARQDAQPAPDPTLPAPTPIPANVTQTAPESATSPPAPPPVPPVPAPNGGAAVNNFCRNVTIDYEDGDQLGTVSDALCAGIAQLREDGGWSINDDKTLVRQSGVSPFWSQRRIRAPYGRPPRGTEEGDRETWSRLLWPRGEGESFLEQLEDLDERLQNTTLYNATSLTDADATRTPKEGELDVRAMSYSLARGLCGRRAPHNEIPNDAQTLRYNIPTVNFPSRIAEKLQGSIATADQIKEKNAGATLIFGDVEIKAVSDFVDGNEKPKRPYAENPKYAMWVPATRVNSTWVMDKNNKQAAALCEAVVYEHLVDYYTAYDRYSTDVWSAKLARACAAAAKIAQLQHMNQVFNLGKLDDLCTPYPFDINNKQQCFFVTRPVMHCPDTGDGHSVLYPCDPGLWTGMFMSKPLAESPPEGFAYDNVNSNNAYGRVVQTGGRRAVKRSVLTPYLRAALRSVGAPEAQTIPIYVAAAPAEGNPLQQPPDGFLEDPPPRRAAVPPSVFVDNSALMKPDTLESVLRRGETLFQRILRYDTEAAFIARLRKEETETAIRGGKALDAEELSRTRRDAVWSDAQREAAIAGDRLYGFVRQLSGTVSESVDAVCQIDEGMLVRQQQQSRERRARISDQAAREHMQLVRNVFTGVLRESGLTLGFGTAEDPSQLKVVSGSLRKQAQELTQQGSQSDGFFSNAVRLEQLLHSGTGELTLGDLFSRLREAGVAMQEAAMASQPIDGLPGSSASLDFLSAPRNSLLLRYKTEALAAVRQAFDVFQREMMAQHGRMYRTISAYELMEGNDEALCTAFATFAAHTLVHARMYSSATAMYVAAWPAAANAQQLKISLQRLVRVAANYLAFTEPPHFTSPAGRRVYFGQERPPTGGSAPMLMAPRFRPQGGMWGVNFYQ